MRTHLRIFYISGTVKNILEDIAQLHFAPSAAHLNVRQNAPQLIHAAGKTLHLSQGLVHLAQALVDLRKLLLQRLIKALVHSHADALQVLVRHIRQTRHTLINLFAQPVARRLVFQACRPRQCALLAAQVVHAFRKPALQKLQPLRRHVRLGASLYQ